MDIARAATERATEFLHLEKSKKEFEFYYKVLPFRSHKDYDHPIDEFIPFHQRKVRQQRAEVEIKHAKRRLDALGTRKQELAELRQVYRNLKTKSRLLETHIKQMKIHPPASGTGQLPVTWAKGRGTISRPGRRCWS